MTTFSKVQSASNFADPAAVTLGAAPTEGNLLIGVLSQRAGTAHADHVLEDTEGGWTKIADASNDQELADANARQSCSVWWKPVTASTPDTFSGDDGTTNSKRLTVVEYAPDGAYTFGVAGAKSANSGTGSSSPLGSGNTGSIASSDLLLIGGGCWRMQTLGGFGAGPLASPLTSGGVTAQGGDNGIAHFIDFAAAGQAAGVKSTSLGWSGSGHEAICWLVAFEDTGGGGTGAVTLSAVAASAEAIESMEGQAAAVLLAPTVQGVGVFGVEGQGTVDLSAPQIVGQAQEEIPGTGDTTLSAVEMSGLAELLLQFAGDVTLSAVEMNGLAEEILQATSTINLGVAEVNALAEEALAGTSVLALTVVEIVGQVQEEIPGEGAVDLSVLEVAGAGTHAEAGEITGSASVVLSVPQVLGQALLVPDGQGTLVLQSPVILGTLQETVPGAAAVILQAPELAGLAVEVLEGGGTLSLTAVSLAGVAEAIARGQADVTLEGIVFSGTGAQVSADIIGSGVITLPVVVVVGGGGYVLLAGYRSARLADVPLRAKTFTVPARVRSVQTPGTS
jgi:hypothetical protein